MLDLAGGDIDALGDLGKDALRDMIRDADGSSDVLEIRPGDPHFPAEAPATIEVGVYGAEGRSEFALLASYGAAARLRSPPSRRGAKKTLSIASATSMSLWRCSRAKDICP